VGVRHKCQSCPDFDFCSDCFQTAKHDHPGHRFAPIYEALDTVPAFKEQHRGIFCDGPLCNSSRAYIQGDRYKCAVCHDTDFCANCEALPNSHNRSHPLIKMKIPYNGVTIHTAHSPYASSEVTHLGDRRPAKHASTETIRTASANAATQVQTVAEVLPAGDGAAKESAKSTEQLQAWYESDSTPDGSVFGPNRLVSQSWTLRNPGPETWPAGCAVHFIGGDDMRNLDFSHPSSVQSMAKANRSNILEHGLEPGKTAVFTVLLKSPSRQGRAISYWRLKTPDDKSFGHKLWVDIEVKEPSIALPFRNVVPVKVEQKSQETVEENKVATVETTVKLEQVEDAQGSTMIFPKLEKESPVSSTHNVAESATEATAVDNETHDLLDDVASLDLEDESEEDGFLTDEEYDLLDCSDEEFEVSK
jgi:next to BRCA1 gene 1 protein